MDINKLKESMLEQEYDKEYIDRCVTYAQNLKERNLPIVFDINHLYRLIGLDTYEFYIIYKSINHQYNVINIPKKNGGYREINTPSENLKFIQRWILDNVLYRIQCKDNVTGFVPDKSIVDNAKVHISKECIIGIDIKDFFPTIHFGRVKGLFQRLGYSTHVSIVLANICTYKGKLPQGAPTSPYIANLICDKLDYRIKKLCDKSFATYTRYADDITISGKRGIETLIPILNVIIEDEGFDINKSKERVLYKYHSQRVTGIVVNEKLSPPKHLVKYIRQNIYYIQKFGLREHLERTNNEFKSNYKEHLYGIAYFIKMIDSDKGTIYLQKLDEIDWDIW